VLQTIAVILVLLWLLGFISHVGGSLIHLVLLTAVIVFVMNLRARRRTV
jgi:Family of unknown function (DUF5670)